jgi:murein DD-endopeptidase MepM/ murein hydrolase activator NlpD
MVIQAGVLAKNTLKNKWFARIAVTAPIALIPLFVYAGVFSVLGGAALGENRSSDTRDSLVDNSQTIDLLQVNLESHKDIKAVGGLKISMADNMALIPDFNPAASGLDLAEITTTTGQISVHTVADGDTISQIAQKYGVSANTIRWANDLGTKGLIKVGQQLTILPVSGVRHRVSKNETLSTIADKLNADVEEIAVFNGFEVDAILKVGSEVIVPDGEIGETIVFKEVSNGSSRTTLITTEPKATYGSSRSVDGYYIKPTAGVVTQWFHGPHQALDIGAPTGTAIVAMAQGVVIVAKNSGYNGGYGEMVIIEHPNKTQTLYAHMSRVDVVQGQKVSQGQTIGAIGSTGRSTGPHLHYEVRGVGKPVKTPIVYSK